MKNREVYEVSVKFVARIAEALYASRAARKCGGEALDEALEAASAIVRGFAWAASIDEALNYWWLPRLAEKLRESLSKLKEATLDCQRRAEEYVESMVIERVVDELSEALQLLDELKLHPK